MQAAGKEDIVKCSLCGTVFDPRENTCGGCVLRKDCRLICCPNCGFGIPEDSKLMSLLRQYRNRKKECE